MTFISQLQSLSSSQSGATGRSTRAETSSDDGGAFASEMNAQQSREEKPDVQAETQKTDPKYKPENDKVDQADTDPKAKLAKSDGDDNKSAEKPDEPSDSIEAVLADLLGLPVQAETQKTDPKDKPENDKVGQADTDPKAKPAKSDGDDDKSAEKTDEPSDSIEAVLADLLGLPVQEEKPKPISNDETIALGLVTVEGEDAGKASSKNFSDFLKNESSMIVSSMKALSTAPQMTDAQTTETLLTASQFPAQAVNGPAPVVNVELANGAFQALPANQTQAQPQVISTERPDWVNNVSASIAQAQDMGAEAMELTLTPENLGKVQIRIEMKDGAASVTIVTQNEDAARLFNDQQNKLSELLGHSGLNLANHNAQSQPERSFGKAPQGLSQSENEPINDLNTVIAAPGMATSLVDLVA